MKILYHAYTSKKQETSDLRTLALSHGISELQLAQCVRPDPAADVVDKITADLEGHAIDSPATASGQGSSASAGVGRTLSQPQGVFEKHPELVFNFVLEYGTHPKTKTHQP